MAQSLTQADWYVDSEVGTLNGNGNGVHGSKTNKFKTLAQGIAAAAVGQVINCTGFFSETALPSKAVTLVGEGVAEWRPPVNGGTMFATDAAQTVRGFTFIGNYPATANTNLNEFRGTLERCDFFYCFLDFEFYNVRDCLFYKTRIDGDSGTGAVWQRVTLYECYGQIVFNGTVSNFIDNIVYNCQDFLIYRNTTTPPVLTRNAIIGTIKYRNNSPTVVITSSDDLKGYGYQTEDYSVNPATGAQWLKADLFADPIDAADPGQYYRPNLHLPVNIQTGTLHYLYNKSGTGIQIGAKPVAYFLGAAAIWNARDVANTSNFEYSVTAGELRKSVNAASGATVKLVTQRLKVPDNIAAGYFFQMLRANFRYVYGSSKIDLAPDTLKTSFNFKFAYTNDPAVTSPPAWTLHEFGENILINGGLGNAEDSFILTNAGQPDAVYFWVWIEIL